ncbi:formate dehydrogenase subunit delta [Sphingomonas colocasiae]|uniref:Formate dehydrogenase subunit delta n=2 Tax=Sphingomonas colocasiae TaxID=1848973 RepID=A0ABS7PRS6_9SPHN|nr:formate dehydrogenase subunit delta [Sphingomonas colocasiae]MBY8824048.1 formate dehydrogenase subunit delta [Sphingomonas colocasiae]
MANQIARNLGAMQHDHAVAAVADHIRMFWDPRMKAKVFADGAGLSPIAAAAIEMLKQGVDPGHQTRATEFNAVDETGGSDAG